MMRDPGPWPRSSPLPCAATGNVSPPEPELSWGGQPRDSLPLPSKPYFREPQTPASTFGMATKPLKKEAGRVSTFEQSKSDPKGGLLMGGGRLTKAGGGASPGRRREWLGRQRGRRRRRNRERSARKPTSPAPAASASASVPASGGEARFLGWCRLGPPPRKYRL